MARNGSGLSVLSVIRQLNDPGFTDGDDLVTATPGARDYDGLAGNDTLSYVSASAAVTASLIPNAANSGAAFGHSFRNIENLTGSRFSDRLTGDDNANVLDGGIGADTLTGGKGNDTYIVDNRADKIDERADQGIDTVRAAITWTLGANLENLTLTGSAAIHGTGNALNNIIIGNSGRNTLTGGAGHDTLDGDAGADTMVGGTGNDIYVVDNRSDIVTEAARGGTDTVHAAIDWTLGAHVENLVLTASAVNGTGNALNNVITGNAANNRLSGGAGNDTLIGGAGNDTLIGGTGDDIYVVDSAADIVTEAARAGTDTVRSTAGTFTLGANVENLELIGTANIHGTGNMLANTITGNSGANTLNGMAGDDFLYGKTGDDTLNGGDGIDYLFGGESIDELNGDAGDDQLYGGAGNDVLYAGAGNDRLDGGAGGDKMMGGQGDDTYIVTSVSDMVSEKPDEGNDTVQASLDFILPENIENLELMGDGDIHGTGNESDNKITGNEGSNIIAGGGGNDDLHGGAGDDLIILESGFAYGGTGNDTIDAEDGSGTLYGGEGDDTYDILGSYVIVEEADGGLDTVIVYGSFALGDHIENGVLKKAQETDRLTGNALDNMLTLTEGGILEGGDGDDTLIVGNGKSVLYGGAGNDVAEFSGAQADYVFSWDAKTRILTATGDMGNHTLEGVEQLRFSDGLYLGSFADLAANSHKTINGTDADDTLNGAGGNDLLYGGHGNDILDGRGGSDTMYGGAGDDIYFVDRSDDIVNEEADQGMDIVKSSASHFFLSPNLENLELIGTGGGADGNNLANRLTGNEIANQLRGHGGNDIIHGHAGDDSLFGGADDDTLHGGADDDQLHGEAGNDTIYGGEGNDTFHVGTGMDALYGGGDEGDKAVFGLNHYEYDYTWDNNSHTLTATNGSNVVTLHGFAILQFNDLRVTDVDQLLT